METAQTITRGSIVGMSDKEAYWFGHQGLVMDPNSDLDEKEYCVAVFFNTEVASYQFTPSKIQSEGGIMNVNDWDERYGEACRKGETDFLFAGDLWKMCPRVVFFKPKDLVVLQEFDLTILAKRLFRNSYHHIYEFKKGTHHVASMYHCWLKDCPAPATRLALFNVWGTIVPMFVCDSCFPEVNGWRGDDTPPLKKDPLIISVAPTAQLA